MECYKKKEYGSDWISKVMMGKMTHRNEDLEKPK